MKTGLYGLRNHRFAILAQVSGFPLSKVAIEMAEAARESTALVKASPDCAVALEGDR